MAKRKANAGLPSTSKPETATVERGERPSEPLPNSAKPLEAARPPARDPVLLRPDPDDGSWHISQFGVQEKTASLEVPVAITGDEMPPRRELDVRNLTPKQSLGLFAIEKGLLTRGVTTDNGCEVNSRQQAVRKLLELAAESVNPGGG